ncbi:hypothetical protein [Sulfuricurvum sp.]|uniref:hypothetical protein n=1 Tax=Sulfuricurvum sp. TaxID=2025608 RepID=UPI00260A6DC0|nr:hypothetical protein [Sulfuricurvum sp.]MDD4949642.1 hypothetical protein [Sulfuricurvum sp.]
MADTTTPDTRDIFTKELDYLHDHQMLLEFIAFTLAGGNAVNSLGLKFHTINFQTATPQQ